MPPRPLRRERRAPGVDRVQAMSRDSSARAGEYTVTSVVVSTSGGREMKVRSFLGSTRWVFGVAVSVFAASLLFAACGNGSGPGSGVVGGPCSIDSQCQSRCFNGGDFGGGMCTVSCRFDADCPSGTVCVDRTNGICAVQCASSRDCAGFGPGWRCDIEPDISGGKTLVCRTG